MNAFLKPVLRALAVVFRDDDTARLSCGNCPRMKRCGLIPADNCTARLMHDERMRQGRVFG